MNEPGSRPSYRLSVVWFTDLVGYIGLAARDQNKDEAFAHLEQLFERHDPMARIIPTSVLLEPLRTNPRFEGLMRQLGLD